MLSNLLQLAQALGLMLLFWLTSAVVVAKLGKYWLLLPAAGAGLVLVFPPANLNGTLYQVALYLFTATGMVLGSQTLRSRFSEQTLDSIFSLGFPLAVALIAWRGMPTG